MADREVVIKIPEEQYKYILRSDNSAFADLVSKEMMMHIIKNGTPLPERHGDLKDMGNLKYVLDLTREDFIYSGKEIERAVKSMTTIVKSNKANKEEQTKKKEGNEYDG